MALERLNSTSALALDRIRRDLATLLASDGYTSIAQAVGADNPL